MANIIESRFIFSSFSLLLISKNSQQKVVPFDQIPLLSRMSGEFDTGNDQKSLICRLKVPNFS
jgi:hypothetical protein